MMFQICLLFVSSSVAGVMDFSALELEYPVLAAQLRDVSLSLYEAARAHAERRGLILADTKFEFGMKGGRLMWIDEALTPDSSRFWPADAYRPGASQPSFDKQYVRDYLETLAWDKTPPGPELPIEVVTRTREKYVEACRRLTEQPQGGAVGQAQ
jgi:phosphoribosylaminoimidazole-succinocarboxamide synthase